jgi:hypothetical protein
MPLWLGALLKVMLINKHKHTKYTESATPFVVKCKKETTFYETYLDLLRNLIVSSLLQNVEMLKKKVSLQDRNQIY